MKTKEQIREKRKEWIKLQKLYAKRGDKKMSVWFEAQRTALYWVLKDGDL